MAIHRTLSALLALLLLVGEASCSGSTSTPRATKSAPPATVSPTSTSSPSNTPRPTHTPSLTPFPPLPQDQAHELISNLDTLSAGCDHACWWGFVPGVTSESAITHIVQQLGLFGPEWRMYQFIELTAADGSYHSGQTYSFESATLSTLGVTLQATDDYSLRGLLTDLGHPADIYVFALNYAGADCATPCTPTNKRGSSLVLYYPSLSMLVLFEGDAFVSDNLMWLCPSEMPDVTLHFWDPREFTFGSITDAMKVIVGYEWQMDYFLPIQELPGYDEEWFFDTYTDSAPWRCFATDRGNWPG